ncbi:MAG: hypothetical protein ACFB21_06135 [Opitutales bacterium]
MLELLQEAVKPYNLPWTILLGLVLLYWLVQIVTGLDFEGDLNFEAEVDMANPDGFLDGLTRFLHVGQVPLMFVIGALALVAWTFSIVGNLFLNPDQVVWLGWLLAVLALIPAVLLARLLLAPVAAFYKQLETKEAGNRSMVGQTCTVITERVDDVYGQGEIHTKDGTFTVSIRPAENCEQLERGDTALIIDRFDDKLVYAVRKVSSDQLAIADHRSAQPESSD